MLQYKLYRTSEPVSTKFLSQEKKNLMQAFIKIRRKPPAFRQGVYGTFGKLSELRIQTEKKIYLHFTLTWRKNLHPRDTLCLCERVKHDLREENML